MSEYDQQNDQATAGLDVEPDEVVATTDSAVEPPTADDVAAATFDARELDQPPTEQQAEGSGADDMTQKKSATSTKKAAPRPVLAQPKPGAAKKSAAPKKPTEKKAPAPKKAAAPRSAAAPKPEGDAVVEAQSRKTELTATVGLRSNPKRQVLVINSPEGRAVAKKALEAIILTDGLTSDERYWATRLIARLKART